MKRNPKDHKVPEYRITEIYPRFFWKLCSKCGMEFKKEKGWRYTRRVTYEHEREFYLCERCTPTLNDVSEYVHSQNKPIMPPERI